MNQSQKIINIEINERQDLKKYCKHLLSILDELENKFERANDELLKGAAGRGLDRRKIAEFVKLCSDVTNSKAGRFFYRK